MSSHVRFTGHDSYKLFSYFEVLKPITGIREIQDPFSTMTLNDLEDGGQRSNLIVVQDLQTMISIKLFSHFKPLG